MDFQDRMIANLLAHLARYPIHSAEDAVKFCFQGMLGVGHLLASRDRVEAYLRQEMDSVTPDPAMPLMEPLSDTWCRLHLQRAKAEGIAPEVIAGWMLRETPVPYTRQDVIDVCVAFDPALRAEAEKLLNPDWLPSHSEVFRAAYHPAYRVIPADSPVPSLLSSNAKKERMLPCG